MPISVGQRLFKVFTLVNSGETLSLPTFCEDGKFDCNFMIPVFADDGGLELRNDKSSLLAMFQDWVVSATFVIQKNIANVWTDQATITDSSYGEYYDIGDITEQPYYAGIVIYWANVLAAFGSGEYRIKLTEVNDFTTNITYSKPYCLKEYGCAIDNSVRIEWYNNFGLGDISDDTSIVDFTGTNWYNQVRIPQSIFHYISSDYTEEEIQFTNGKFQDVKNVQSERYQLVLGGLPMWMHRILKTYCFQSGEVYITDYSNNAPEEIIGKAVKIASSYPPRPKKSSACWPVTLEFKPTYNRYEQWKCLPSNAIPIT